jgi:hypothetical protein
MNAGSAGASGGAGRDLQARDVDVRADWEQRIYQRLAGPDGTDGQLALPAPARVTAESAVGHIRLK